jgi:two-component system, chemotaxis family, sensor kinase CheA
MLRPLIESLGYHVVAAGEGVDADILIQSVGDRAPANTRAGQVVSIRSQPEMAGENDNSIYRYDRAGLIQALRAGNSGEGRNG